MRGALFFLFVRFGFLVSVGSPSPMSPWAMAAETERWLVEGAGARFPIGMAGPAREAGGVVFVDDAWPSPFQDRIGEAITMRVSPVTGCYEFVDGDGIVFWTVVPVAPLTWDWISPFHSPDRPDPWGLYSPFRLSRVWVLFPHAEFAESAEPFRLFSGRRAPGAPNMKLSNLQTFEPSNLCFTAFVCSETNLRFTASWPTNNAGGAGVSPVGLPGNGLDLYGTSNLLARSWTLLSSHPATNPPVSFSVERASLPWFNGLPPHVHDESCSVVTNFVVSPLDGTTVYTNVVYECSAPHSCETGFFRLGTRADTDGDGLTDAFELLSSDSDPDEPDTDFDDLSDAEESSLGTDPRLPDTDGDGMSDDEELLSGCNPLVPGLPVGATIRYVHDDDDRLVGAFPGGSPATSTSRWSPAGNPVRSRERGVK